MVIIDNLQGLADPNQSNMLQVRRSTQTESGSRTNEFPSRRMSIGGPKNVISAKINDFGSKSLVIIGNLQGLADPNQSNMLQVRRSTQTESGSRTNEFPSRRVSVGGPKNVISAKINDFGRTSSKNCGCLQGLTDPNRIIKSRVQKNTKTRAGSNRSAFPSRRVSLDGSKSAKNAQNKVS